MTDSSVATERITLTWDQVAALHIAFNRWKAKQEGQRTADWTASGFTPIRTSPPLPACPVCGTVPGEIRQRNDRITPSEDMAFDRCGHVVHVTEAMLEQLWTKTQYIHDRGSCSCEDRRCPGCQLGAEVEQQSALASGPWPLGR
ncbi:MAG: hypothetical protein JWO67_6684 [Streptosporangiaceae bacterium]|nr:hypothetical protein [Streptosporangiaceae bacterium]